MPRPTRTLAPIEGVTSALTEQSLLDAIPVLAALVRLNGDILCCNSRFRDALGAGRHDKGPASVEEILPLGEVEELLAGRHLCKLRNRHAPNGAAPIWVAWSSCPWPAKEDLILLTGVDVTREAELENYIAENQWFETAAALSGGLAHDFNNALAGILGLAEIVGLRLPEDSPLRPFTLRIGGSIDRAKILVRRFSQFSRKSSGAVEAQPTALILDELAPLLKAFMPSNVTVNAELDPETPWCLADRHELEHILLNCCTLFRARLRASGGSVLIACAPLKERPGSLIELTASGEGLLGFALDRVFELDLKSSATAYDSGAAGFTAQKLAKRAQSSLWIQRDDARTVRFSLQLRPAIPEEG